MKKVLVTGANSQLASEIKELELNYPRLEFIFADKTEFPLDKKEDIITNFKKIKPDVVINCAAYTAVDKAEDDTMTADAVNRLGVGILAKLCHESDTQLIHISTDYVFDGESPIPYKEDDIPNPKNAYGLTKLAGEMVCQENCPNSVVIRTSWLYSIFGNNFVKTMLRLMSERDTFGVVNDQIGSPTYAGDLAQAIMDIIEFKTWIGGIYHYSNEGNISWFEFALAIKEIAEETCNIKPIDSSSYPTPAKRPNYSLLDNTKIQEVYGIQTIDYLISLRRMMEKLG